MAWQDRIVEAVYISPGGEEFRFQYEDLQKEIIKKTTAFDFPDVDGTYIQDLGKSGRRYPMRIIFWGADYDRIANRFDDALEEKGPGRLRHPFYGEFDVVPFGTIKRMDNLTSAGNQVIYELSFFETIPIVFPISTINALTNIEEGLLFYTDFTGENFGDSISVETANEELSFIDSAKAAIRKIKREMTAITETLDDISRQFNDLFEIIDNSIETLIGTPTLLATQIIQLSTLPARSSANILAKLDGYRNLIDSFTLGSQNQFEPANDSSNDNAFALNNLSASAAVSGSIESTISEFSEYSTRTQTILAIEQLIENFETYTSWSDENRERMIAGAKPTRKSGTNDLIDTGEGYQKLQEIYALANGRLTEIVFTALQEREIKLQKSRTIIDFAAEFYGSIDDQLNFIINSNNLSGSEILEIKKNRKMLYYV